LAHQMGLVGVIGDLCSTESPRALTAVTLFARDIEPGANMHSAERPY